MSRTPERRRYPIGAEILADGTAHVRVWAPGRRRVEVQVVAGGPDHADGHARRGASGLVALAAEGGGDGDDRGAGYFSGAVPGLGAGGRYAFRLDGEDKLYPDPASRFQPDGPHGPSELIDPSRFDWTDGDWRGPAAAGDGAGASGGQILYELHVGTFTPEGTYAAAARELPALRELGVTTVELMPLAEWSGRFGWGYDGVDLWAPTRLYGRPDDLRRFVDRAHRLGIAVILDVVYNHLGPDGNYLKAFAPAYFTDRHENEWGEALNFDGPDAGPVREFFVENAAYWIDELHLDGLRLDATHAIQDASAEHVLAALGQRARAAAAARGRAIWIVAENESQEARLVRPLDERAGARGGYGLDALWNDDFHHSAVVALTGRAEAYYSDHRGAPQELLSALRWGYLFQGQWYRWQKQGRGVAALDLPASAFVSYLENHDQVANSGRGARLTSLAAPGRLRAMTAVLLLGPATPMLFQGQEWGSTRPFLYFADHGGDLGAAVAKGRKQFLSQFPALASAAAQARLDDPGAEATFARCKLDRAGASEPDRAAREASLALHRDLIALRREDAAFRQRRADRLHGAVLGPEAFVVRVLADRPEDTRLLLVNLGADLPLSPIPEPLLAPPEAPGGGRARWTVRWSSEDPRYGGGGTPALATDATWVLPGQSALVLAPATEDAEASK